MRISDDRYARDLQRIDLAWRLIGHEARTQTIRQWTGLSDDRIRKLYRSYVQCNRVTGPLLLRHRGKSPRRTAYFFRNPELHFEATQLAGLFLMHGLLEGTDEGVEPCYRLGALDSGGLLCQSYEAYVELHSPPCISFEHAWFLLFALGHRGELTLRRCPACGALELRDPYGRLRASCGGCQGSTGSDKGSARPC